VGDEKDQAPPICAGVAVLTPSSSRIDADKSMAEDLIREIGGLENMMLIGIDGRPTHDTGKQA
jgi:hypothetical protein